jgi:hypothetical protein
MELIKALEEVVCAIKSWVDANKVSKVEGMGLSTNDYTSEDKNKVANIPNGLVIIDDKICLAQNGIAIENAAVTLPIIEESDPTVPDWAKEATKPTYTANDVGALPSTTKIPNTLADLTSDSTHRLVTDIEKTFWNNKSSFSGNYNDLTNKPSIPDDEYINNLIDAKFALITSAEEVAF